MLDFDALAAAIPRQTVLCIGDVMLDEFVYGEVARVSPEAPAPVIAVRRSEQTIGGAGNVARNIAALGAHCIFVSVIGEDEAAAAIKARFDDEPLIEPMLVHDLSRPTTRKMRFVSEQFSTHMLRADWETAAPVSPAIEQTLIEAIATMMPRADVVLLSDYAKGVLTQRVVRATIDAARKDGKRVIVDPKTRDFAFYHGAAVLTPNWKEFADAARAPVSTQTELIAAGREMMRHTGSEAMLVTQSEHGMTLVTRDGMPVHVPAHPVKVRDVSGAGDTVAAMLAVALAADADWDTALRAANAAAAVAVGKKGTATVSLTELRTQLLPHASLVTETKIAATPDQLAHRLAQWRQDDLRIGFTNGCFDILHPGHVKVITQARAACDRLILGLNSDASVRRLKGAERPLQNQHARAEVLAALEAVDLVVIFDEDTPLDLITRIKPHVLVKGGDYTREQVVGHEIVEAYGGEVVLVDVLQGFSTTSLVQRARSGRL